MRRDQLTYDIDRRRTSGLAGVNPRLLVLLIIVLALAILLVVWTVSSGSSPSSTAPDHGTRPHTPARALSSATSSPTPSPALVGTDADHANRVPGGSRTAAVRFIAAWLDRVPKTRRAELQQTATSGLAEELMLTSQANIPKATAKGAPRLEDASEYSVQFTQLLSDGMRIRVYLVADPQSRYGWTATSVEQA